jgi:hypothetical protein
MPDAPIRSVDCPGHGFTPVGRRLLDAWAKSQPHGVTEACERVAAACGVSRPLVGHWRTEPHKWPASKYHPGILASTGIEASNWELWERLGPDEPAAASPESGPREVALPELTGSPAERLRTLEVWLEGRTRSGHGLPLDLSRSVAAMRDSIREQRSQKPIPDLHEHPDYQAVIALILGAVSKYPGAARSIIEAIRSSQPSEAEAA